MRQHLFCKQQILPIGPHNFAIREKESRGECKSYWWFDCIVVEESYVFRVLRLHISKKEERETKQWRMAHLYY